MNTYEDLLRRVYLDGEIRSDRTGTGTLSVFGGTMEYDLRRGLVPLVTTKRVAWKKSLLELLWKLRGESSLSGLGEAANIWEPWADEKGDLGPVYGVQWRSWGDGFRKIDQLADLVKLLRENPDTRQAVLSAWNVGELPGMALPPCPVLHQFSVREGRYLDLSVYQRSADMFLGVPFDIFQDAVLCRLMALELGLEAGVYRWYGGDCHVYTNHQEQVRVQLQRTPRALPFLDITRGTLSSTVLAVRTDDPRAYHVDQFSLMGYNPHDGLRGSVSV